MDGLTHGFTSGLIYGLTPGFTGLTHELVPFAIGLALVLGLLIGSFLNVVVVRLPLGESLVLPRSHCVSCQAKIRWYDNLPFFSYLFLKGKCRDCKTAISIRYPVIEMLTALLFVASGIRFGWLPHVLILRDWPFLAMLICITFIDLEHRVIPDELSLGGMILGILTFWIRPQFSWMEAIGGAALGFSIFYSLSWLYQKFRGHLGLGGGDVKLLAMIGAFLGPPGVLVTICVSSVFGSLVGLVWAGVSKQKNLMQFSIPYGPFLVIGALFYYFFGDFFYGTYP